MLLHKQYVFLIPYGREHPLREKENVSLYANRKVVTQTKLKYLSLWVNQRDFKALSLFIVL